MRPPKILVVYKRSSLMLAKNAPAALKNAERFRRNHARHYQSLKIVESALKALGVAFKKRSRRPNLDYRRYDLVITVGGDGTFLDAARHLDSRQAILGVNSDPNWSVGQFCCTDAAGFSNIMKKVLNKTARSVRVCKLRLRFRQKTVECLNDILICHANPAAMSRYELAIGRRKEEHRSSGLWFSSAAGSTGAILSAGGKKMPLTSRDIQYRPRELYHARQDPYLMKGGTIALPARVVSHMRYGKIFLDGAHVHYPFAYGQTVIVSPSANHIRMIHV